MAVWIAHDHPERPLAYGAWLCGCRFCDLALHAAVLADPSLRVVVKTRTGRLGLAARVWLSGAMHPSLSDGYEVFVAPGSGARGFE